MVSHFCRTELGCEKGMGADEPATPRATWNATPSRWRRNCWA